MAHESWSVRIAVVSMNRLGCLPEALGESLAHLGIAVRTGLHCAPGAHRAIGTFPSGTLRVSPGYFTNPSDIDQFLLSFAEFHDRDSRDSAKLNSDNLSLKEMT